MSIYWPIVLIVLSNIFYHVCSKSLPDQINPFAALTVTYCVGGMVSLLLYFLLRSGGTLMQELKNLNWSSLVLGIAIVGLEAGSIYMYKVGWNINTGSIVHSSILALLLILIGFFFYKEPITMNKVIGAGICMVGLYFINK